MMSGWNRTIDPLGKSHEFFGHPSEPGLARSSWYKSTMA